jgi:hypothetical protein
MANLELDHVVVFVSPDAPEARAVEAAGLQGFGGATLHEGMGTGSTSFFFAGLNYLELLWVADPAAAARQFEPVSLDVNARTGWRASGAAPFGLMLRRREPGSTGPLPFATHSMPAAWMPPGTIVEFNGEAAAEPYYGVVPETLSFRGFRANIEDRPHPLGVKALTAVTLTLTTPDRSAIARRLEADGIVRFKAGEEPRLTLTFDGGGQGKTVDLRPALPIRFEL